jgi:exodeoxyribonuclease III
MKIATWNVNSIRARRDRFLAWLEDRRPDIVGLQELKTEDPGFPRAECEALGYSVETYGQRTYNGVALLSRSPLSDVERGFGDGVEDPQARFIAATTAGLRVMSAYFPNGQSVGSEKFAYKLSWIARLRRYLAARLPSSPPALLIGDFNVAPEDQDVHDPALWAGQVLCSPEERAALADLKTAGLADLVRHLIPKGQLFSWWDYRNLGFPKNYGLRIDHIFATPNLLPRAAAAGVDREARKGKQPSDHAPVWAELKEAGDGE